MSPSLPLLHSGKVRELYDAGEGLLLMVASDRVSAFDVVLSEAIPNKGRVLTALSAFWLDRMAELLAGHMVSTDPSSFPPGSPVEVAGRAMLVRRAEMLPIECIVRGYLSGSAWKEYSASGTVNSRKVPSGLLESDRLPEPLFTPSTKATVGHDVNLSEDEARELVGSDLFERVESVCLAAYSRAAEWSESRGIILADTKFELGFVDGELTLCDEVLTPDSSRFWPAESWKPGATPPSYDKQPLRDWLEASGWDKTPPAPHLPDDVVRETSARYVKAYEVISGLRLEDWWGAGAD